ncbi:ABC transporter related [Catenulispora acidiphila DSM 44928]|uniref:ABC transporter related n=1 Tax=Catenulispora acidiphila (strain DSM 44928 / JCM 14897 / NBRC 102108 / NRRL B-24433 / ID139908) TaxID=479433 RepID=C7Q441_CATAD|nr:ATP-binding cassette domain-containing protein [Catenulispora acidiphila]ACU69901.1 ABC transporter related [Catenulispora acidiphila DSM 44928]
MGHIDVNSLQYHLPDGRVLLEDVSFRIGDGDKAALVGVNGAGKTTLLRLIAGDIEATGGAVVRSGGLGVMRQFVDRKVEDGEQPPTVRTLLLSVAPPALQRAAAELEASELAMMEDDSEPTQMRYAQALSDWGDVGGYEAETLWDTCCTIAIGIPYIQAQFRAASTLSGGEQKRLVLESLVRGPDQVLLLDEPDNFLDVPGKRWLEQVINETPKTVLFVTHDRELLAGTAKKIVTVEVGSSGGIGGSVWIHGGGFANYHEVRKARFDRFEELLRRWEEEHRRLKDLVNELRQQAKVSEVMAAKYRVMCGRLERFEQAGPPPAPPREQQVKMRLKGGRTGVRAFECVDLELSGLMKPFATEVFYGERVAVLGGNGSGKSHFLRLLAGEEIAHTGTFKLGARVVPGHFRQTHRQPALEKKTLLEILWEEFSFQRDNASPTLARYALNEQAEQRFGNLSGGQQARFQILRLELTGSTMLLLDEPTDNLDLMSADALEAGLEAYQGTVIAVTHDRWFARGFDRYLVFGSDGRVYEAPEPVWDERRPDRRPVKSGAKS